MSSIYLTEDNVKNILSIDTTIELVEEIFREHSKGNAFNMPRQRMRIRKGMLHMLSAAIPYKGVLGYKAYTSFKAGTQFKVFLHSAETGQLLAIIDANELGRLRTAAASAIATKHMAKKENNLHLVFGAGFQAETQIIAITKVLNIKKTILVNRNKERGDNCIKNIKSKCLLDIERTENHKDYISRADIITTITTAKDPLFEVSEINEKGVHINAAGSNSLIRRELSEKIIEKADILAVDSKDVALLECGDILPSLEKGRLHVNEILELGDIVSGKIMGRKNDKEITIFESHGMGLQDIVCAHYIYNNAIKSKIGQPLPF
ncbi:MAG: ornithine cyclodeaminase family protein [Deferribacterota bacterium]|nr:ornithine cyclodeaminase family protein [Deferribacterota bacterium]